MIDTTKQPRPMLTAAMLGATAAAALAALIAASGPAGAEPATTSSGSAGSPPPPPAARGADVPAERSKPPTATEWKEGRPISVEGAHAACTFKVLREYLRASCTDFVGVGLVAGEPADVRVWVSGNTGWDHATSTMRHATAIADVPLRRGQAFIVSFNDIEWDYGGGSFGDGGHLHVSWRDGDPDPLIVMTSGSRP